MAEVGVLNLTIHDNSEEAAKGLDQLDDALVRIKHAVSGGLKLGTVATSLKKLTDVVNNELSGSTLVKLGQLADELSKLKGMGDLNIRIGGGTSIESIRTAVRETMQDMSGINTGFEEIKGSAYDAKSGIDGINASMRQTQELMQNKAWSGGIEQFREMLEAYLRIRSALSLPAGDQTGISTQVENGWTAWKEGAIEVEGTVSEAMDTVTKRLGEPIKYLTGMSSQVGSLNNYLGQTNDMLEEMARNTSSMSSGENAIIPYTGIKKDIKDILEETEQVTAKTNDATNAADEYAKRFEAILEAKKEEAALANSANRKIEAEFNYGNMKTAIQVAKEARGMISQDTGISEQTKDASIFSSVAERLSGLLAKLGDRFAALRSDINESGGSFAYLKSKMSALFPTLSSLGKRFKSIIIMRSLRYVIRQIAAGFSEGVQNVYQYSKAVGTSLAPAMDQAATALQQMKNSVGAAVAPLIQSLVPVLQTVVNWFITAVNYANQFFALLRGQSTWTRALPEQAEAFKKSTKSAKGASKAMKDLLADWDELNIIQSQSGGGAGSAADAKAEEYKNMFEEVSEFSEAVRNVVDFIEDKLGGIPGILKKAGIALLGWKLSKAFSGDLATLQNLSMAAGLVLSIVGITLAENAGYNIGRYGISNQNILEAVEGVVSTALGGALIGFRVGGFTGAAIGLVLGTVISLFVLGANIRRGYLDSLYGDLHKDADEIRKEIEEKFLTVEAKAQIDVTDAQLKDLTDAESKVKGAIEDLNKSYPVDVQITPDNADDFLSKVQTLVNATNTLIEESKETIALSVPATPFFTSTFVNDAWTDVQGYVDELGKLIGEELSNQITDNTNLDQLRKDLLEISNAVLNATNSSEFTGKVGVAGAATRKNTSSGTYDRETVENYIKEYNAYSEEIFGKATAYAQAQYTERERLVASLETAIDQEKTAREKGQGRLSDAKYEKLQKDLEIAIKERDAFFADGEGILEYARKLYDEWSLAGRSMFESDIVSALRAAMGLNADRVYEGQKVINNATMGKGANNDEWVNTYIQSNKNSLMDAISTLTGMPKNQIQQLIENTGLDPLSFFDEDFVSSYRNSIVRWLATSELSDAQKERVLSSIGLDFDDGVKKMMEEAKKQALASSDMDQLNDDFSRWAFNNMGIFAYKPEEYTEYGQTGYSQGYKFTAPVELQTTEISLDVDELKKEIEEAMTDGWMSTEEYSDLIHKYGQNLFEMTLKELQYNLDEEGYNRGSIRPVGMVAGMGMSDVNWQPYVTPTTTNTMEGADISGDVAKGTAQGNNEQNDLIQQLIQIATQIANKDFKVVVSPNANWGNFNSRSNQAFEKVTG